jgi:polyisoprenyl-phosphate glycosyltransferase
MELCERVQKVMQSVPYLYEHICIDNRSTDRTVAILRERAALDPNLKIIVNNRNFGSVKSDVRSAYF